MHILLYQISLRLLLLNGWDYTLAKFLRQAGFS